jgi:hypothetical protein
VSRRSCFAPRSESGSRSPESRANAGISHAVTCVPRSESSETIVAISTFRSPAVGPCIGTRAACGSKPPDPPPLLEPQFHLFLGSDLPKISSYKSSRSRRARRCGRSSSSRARRCERLSSSRGKGRVRSSASGRRPSRGMKRRPHRMAAKSRPTSVATRSPGRSRFDSQNRARRFSSSVLRGPAASVASCKTTVSRAAFGRFGRSSRTRRGSFGCPESGSPSAAGSDLDPKEPSASGSQDALRASRPPGLQTPWCKPRRRIKLGRICQASGHGLE